MHIPDGYLSPQTYVPTYGIMVPLWAWASRRLRQSLRLRQIPMLALASSFSFVVMMFNVPIPGGTTGHAVGSVLVAVLLGPWAALVAVSLTLAIQALLFGDGGITALAANCLNMAVLMPAAGWAVYQAIASGAPASSWRHWAGAALGGYLGSNAAALGTAVCFGLQPLLARDAAGRALYSPFGLEVAIPAMMVSHLLVFGFVEALVTGLVVAHFQRTEPSMLPAARAAGTADVPRPQAARRLALGLLALVLLSPLGLLLPAWLRAGDAWGEYAPEHVGELVGYIPAGLSRLAGLWRAPLPDYAAPGGAEVGLGLASLWYVAAGLAGLLAIWAAALGLRRLLSSGEAR